MNIAFVSSGNSIHVKKLANGLVGHGHKVTLFTLRNHNKLAREFDERIRLVYLPFGGKAGYILNAPILRHLVKTGEFDVVNCHYVTGYGTLARLAQVQPLVSAVFGSDVYTYPNKSKIAMKRIIKNLDAAKVITSTSQVMADEVRKFYKRDREIFVTPFGVDITLFKPTREKRAHPVFTFGTVKKLEDTYGIHYLIRAFAGLLDRIGDENRGKVLLSIYGFGSKEAEYKKLVKELHVEDRVKFNGFIRNELVPTAFHSMDVACFPSESESFGVAAIEAMACGVPVIASDASGFTEVIEDKKTGYIVPKKDINALTDKMIEMFSMDNTTLLEMGRRGVLRVAQTYNFEDNIATYIEAIKQAIEV